MTQPSLCQEARDFAGSFFGAVDEPNAGTHHAGYDGLDERIVSAAEYERVYTGDSERCEVILRNELDRGMIEPTFLDEGNKERARAGCHVHAVVQSMDGALVRSGAHGTSGADDTDTMSR